MERWTRSTIKDDSDCVVVRKPAKGSADEKKPVKEEEVVRCGTVKTETSGKTRKPQNDAIIESVHRGVAARSNCLCTR